MINQATIELIGYVHGNPKNPKPDQYPNWVKFSLSVTKKWKNKAGEDKKEVYWYKCSSWSEGLSKVIKNNVKSGMGLLVKGFPKSNAYIDKDGVAKSQIEVNILDINMLTFPKDRDDDNNQNSCNASSKENGRYSLGNNKTASTPDSEMRDDDIPF